MEVYDGPVWINPYWTEWKRVTGQTKTWEYMAWISARHVEYRKQFAMSGHERDYVQKFTTWLRALT